MDTLAHLCHFGFAYLLLEGDTHAGCPIPFRNVEFRDGMRLRLCSPLRWNMIGLRDKFLLSCLYFLECMKCVAYRIILRR